MLRLDQIPATAGNGESTPLDSVREVVFSPDGKWLAFRGEPGEPSLPRRLVVYDIRAEKVLSRIDWPVAQVTRMGLAADGKTLVAYSPDAAGGLQTWSLPDGRPVRAVAGGRGPVVLLDSAAKAGVIAPAGKNEVLRIHSLATGEETQRFVLPVTYQSEFRGDGLAVAATLRFGDPTIRILDVRTARESIALRGGSRPPTVIRFSPDGRTLAGAYSDRMILLWELASGEPVFSLSGSAGSVLAAAFSPDKRHLVTSGTDPIVRVWEVASGKEVHQFRGHTRPVSTVAYSPDGRRIATGSFDRSVIVWDATRISKSFLSGDALDEKGMTKLWDDLAASSPAAAYPAIGRIRVTADSTIPLLRERVRLSLVPIEKSRIEQRIRDLGDADSIVRHRATDELRRIRDIARPALVRAAKESSSAEVRSRARRLLLLADNQPRFSPGDIRRMQRVVHALESIPGADTEAILELINRELPDAAVARDAAETLSRLRRS